MNLRSRPRRLKTDPIVLSGLVCLASVAYVFHTPASILRDVPEVAAPLAITAALLLFTARVRRRDRQSARTERMATYGWWGALVAFAISAWWVLLHLYEGVPVAGLGEQILTVWSVGIGVGAFVGGYEARKRGLRRRADRDALLAETVWVNRQSPTPILDATVEQLAELEGVRPLELDPLNDHVDPDVFADLRARSDAQWQFAFYADGYEVRVSSQGTITVYDADAGAAPPQSG